jgi:hypothetical protein
MPNYAEWAYTVPKTRQISEKIREKIPWKENFPVVRGNDDYFPRITGKFSLQGTSSSLPTKICQIFGTVYQLESKPLLGYEKTWVIRNPEENYLML